MSREDIAIRVVEERTRLGFSQRDFAQKLDVSNETVRRYEIGEREIGSEFLARAATLGLDVQYVLTGVASANRAELPRAEEIPAPSAAPKVAVNGSSNVVGVVEKGGKVNQIHTTNHVTRIKAEVKPGEEHITEEQAAVLTRLVGEIVELEGKVKKTPKTFRAVWSALNAHMKVASYRLIPAAGFAKAEKYLRQWLGRLNAAPSASKNDGDAWRKRKYAYIKINSKEDPERLERYIKREFKADSLTDLSNEELEQVYRYVATRKRDQKRGKE